jgi:hypothetical protein
MVKASLLIVIVVSAAGVLILNLTPTTIMTNVAHASTCIGTSSTHKGSLSLSTTFSGACSIANVAVQKFVGPTASGGQ